MAASYGDLALILAVTLSLQTSKVNAPKRSSTLNGLRVYNILFLNSDELQWARKLLEQALGGKKSQEAEKKAYS